MRRELGKLLALDNDDAVLSQIARVFGGSLIVLQVRSPSRAMGILEVDRAVRAIITEQVMPSANGVDLLETVRTRFPHVRRVMLTAYSDLATIVGAIHSGAVQCLVQKPASDSELIAAVFPEAAHRVAELRRRASA